MLTSVTVKGEPRKRHTELSNWTSGRPADSVMDFRLTFGEGQARLFEKVTCHLRQGQCRSGHQRRSVLRVTADKSNIHLCEGQLWTSKRHTVLLCWTSGRPPDSVMDFRLTFEEGQAWLFVKLTSYPWQSQCRSRYQRRSKHLEKVTRCSHAWPLQDLSLRLISLVRFRRDSRLTLKKVKSDCFRRSLPIRTSEKVSVEDNSWWAECWPLWRSRVNLEKDTRCFQTGLLEGQPIPSWTSDWLWRRSSATVWEGYISPPTRSMPIRTSEKVKTSRKSHTVLSCLTSAESFITPVFVGTIPLDSVRFRRLHPTDSTTIFDQADDYQENASLSVSEQVPHEKSRSSSRKSAAGTVLTVFGSSAGHSFGKPLRGCVSETSLLSQLTRPRKLESRSVSTIDESLMTGKRDRGESIGQSMRDRENLHKILEREAESSIQGENEDQKNYQRLKLMWKLEGGSKEVQKLLYMNPIENLKLKDYSFFRRIYGTMLEAKESVCVGNWKRGTSASKKVAQKIAKKLKNCEGVAVKRVTELDKQNWMNCPWCNRGILKQWVTG